MKVFTISPIGKTTPMLFDTIDSVFQIVGDINQADVVFFDMFSGLGNYDESVLFNVYMKDIPIVFFDESDYGGCEDGTDEWFGFNYFNCGVGNPAKIFYEEVVGLKKIIYFMRKMDKTKQFPPFVYPLDLLMYPDHDFRPTTADELFSRDMDFCFIGNTSPTRKNFINGLINCNKFNMISYFPKDRISHDNWLKEHRKAKCYIESCGGGFGSERPFQLSSISVQLRNRTNQKFVVPPIDLVDCIEADENPTPEDIKKIQSVLENKELLYEIYLNGIERMKKYFNAEFRAKYILKVIQNNFEI